eukprot:TRINITY_DN5493_c0_g1_i1.p1 TRINITY_DN5493_c0_g1~~TRINITY_DN5493_c0_g1_i1.p1  ORF type:complete len:304 (-),score=72.40 TRINITY_DN5493_c0_g1_i1:42-953(-)
MTAAMPPGLAPPPSEAPPGLTPPAGPPPSRPAEHAEGAPDLKQEISEKIGQQVQALLLLAKKESEAKVTTELRHFHSAMQEVDARLDQIIKQLDEVDEGPRPESLEQNSVVQALAKVEQQWGKELCKLKSELHQTIFAHNHNADLMKHQKEALDLIRNEIDMRSAPSHNLDRMNRARGVLRTAEVWQKSAPTRSKRSEPILQRMTALEHKVAAAWRWPGTAMSQMSRASALTAMAAAKSQVRVPYPHDFGGYYGDGSAALSAAASGMYTAAKEELEDDDDEETSLEQVLAKALAATGVGSSTG